MAHRANIEFDLYTGLSPTATDSFHAYEHVKASGINFRHLHYGDPQQAVEVENTLKTWFPDEPDINMPFVVYVEAYDFKDVPNRVLKIVKGLSAIKAVDWKALSDFEG